jgi:hypothetical protein
MLIERSVETPRSPSIAAKSLAEPPEACRPQEGLKSRRAQAPGDTWQDLEKACCMKSSSMVVEIVNDEAVEKC